MIQACLPLARHIDVCSSKQCDQWVSSVGETLLLYTLIRYPNVSFVLTLLISC